MNTYLRTRKIAAVFLLAALFAPYFISVGVVPPKVVGQEDPLIVIDMTHGQYSSYVFGEEDTWLENNLTAMGYDVVFAYGGLNDTILADADGLLVGTIYGTSNGFTNQEVTDVADWFNAGGKFMWVGSDSDYAGYAYINANSSLILDAVGSHVYPEAISISDAISNCNASYRVVANKTSTNAFVANIVDGVDAVLMHGPTSLYGSTSGAEGTDVVALETTTIANVYPVLYYGASATIGDSDLVPPLANDDGDSGEFVAMTIEMNAGEAGTGVIIVSGASPYGDYQPMFTTEYYDVPLNGDALVKQAIEFGMNPPTGFAIDPLLLMGIAGAVIVVIIVVVVLKRR
ncbi:MAG: hypothetical protein ACFFEM_09950 [Candidatus Thorarchaeota archaeon]